MMCVCNKIELNGKWMDGKWIEWMWKGKWKVARFRISHMHTSPKINSNFSRSAVRGNYGHKRTDTINTQRAFMCT